VLRQDHNISFDRVHLEKLHMRDETVLLLFDDESFFSILTTALQSA